MVEDGEYPFFTCARESYRINRYAFDAEALLVSGNGANVGYVHYYKGKFNAYQRTYVLSDFTVDVHFLKMFLDRNLQDRIRVEVNAGNTPYITMGTLAEMEVVLPSDAAEQRAIATALSDVDGLLGGLDRLITKKRDLKQAAMQQLLTGQTRLPGFHGEWEVRRLGEVTDTDPENLGSETRPDFAFNYISLEDIDQGMLRGHSEQVFRTAPSRARRKLRDNDILVSTVRPNLKSHLLFRDNGQTWVCSTGFCIVRCRGKQTHPGYVFFHMFGHPVARQIEALLTGSNYPAINSTDVRALEIPLPDFDEQNAIAEVLTEMDAELAGLEQRREKTRALKQAMMQELLTGRIRLV
jgi:type I restriction enzyme S subunit